MRPRQILKYLPRNTVKFTVLDPLTSPVGQGPYPTSHTTPAQDRVMPDMWRAIFDDYEDSSAWPGCQYGVSTFGSENMYGKCAKCMGPMFIVQEEGLIVCPKCGHRKEVTHPMRINEQPNMNYGPKQRRQLAVDDPKDQKIQPNLTMEVDQTVPQNGPMFDPLGRDVGYPSLMGENY